MDKRKNRNQIQNALNTTLSGLQDDPWLAQRVIAEAKGERKVKRKKKVSVGLIICLILLLVSTTALAITILSYKSFVGQVIAPMTSITEDNQWTDEEIQMIISLAQKNQIELPNNIIETLTSTEPIYKEELMLLLMKQEMGLFPASWPLEEQAWYDELLVRYGLRPERTRFLPEENEISQEQAMQISMDYVKQRWDTDVNQGYNQYVQYMLTEDEAGQLCKRWDIEFESAAQSTTYIVIVTPEGNVVDTDSMESIRTVERAGNETKHKVPTDIYALEKLMHADDFYTVENLAHFAENYKDLIIANDLPNYEIFDVMKGLLSIPYAMPRLQDITSQKAMEVANQAIMEYGWSETWLSRCRSSISYRVYDKNAPVYRICYKVSNENRSFFPQEMPFGIIAYINAETGDVISITQLDGLDPFDCYCEFPDPHDSIDYDLGVG